MRPQTLGLTSLLLVQVLSVSAQGPSTETRSRSGEAASFEKLAFDTSFYADVHEGYVSLRWNDVLAYRTSETGALYRVYNQDHLTVYRGSLPTAFVSGLSDGEYQFHVAAIDAGGKALARSDVPARVVVEHWSLQHALLLFGVGFVVFVVLLGVIVHGTRRGVRRDQISTAVDAEVGR